MSPTYTRRKNRHYGYYISQAMLQFREDEAGSVIRVPGKALEDTVTRLFLDLLASPDQILNLLRPYACSGIVLEGAVQSAGQWARQWPALPSEEKIPIINTWISKIEVAKKEVCVTINCAELIQSLIDEYPAQLPEVGIKPPAELVLKTKVSLKRSGIETKLVYPSGPSPGAHTRSVKALQKALLTSLQWNEELISGRVRSIDALIQRDNLNPRQVHRLRKLAFLAPDIMERVIACDVPDTLTLERLKKDFPLDWQVQRVHFGLSQHPH